MSKYIYLTAGSSKTLTLDEDATINIDASEIVGSITVTESNGKVNYIPINKAPYKAQLGKWLGVTTILIKADSLSGSIGYEVENTINDSVATYATDASGNVIGLSGVTGTTWALKPAAASYIGTAFITDIGGGTYWVSNGVKWRPMNGRCLLSDLSADTTSGVIPISAIGAATVLRNISFPANFWQDGDTIGIRCKAIKNGGTTDTLLVPFFISSNASIGTNLLTGASQVKLSDLATTTIMSVSYHRLQRVSSTSIRFMGTAGGANENSTSTNPFLITGLPNLDAAFNLQICAYKTVGTSPETITLVQSQVDIESVLGV